MHLFREQNQKLFSECHFIDCLRHYCEEAHGSTFEVMIVKHWEGRKQFRVSMFENER